MGQSTNSSIMDLFNILIINAFDVYIMVWACIDDSNTLARNFPILVPVNQVLVICAIMVEAIHVTGLTTEEYTPKIGARKLLKI